MNNYTRKCPNCHKELSYKHKHGLKYAILKNSNCSSCTNMGENNPFYNKTHTIEHKQYMRDLSPTKRPEVRKKLSEATSCVPKTKEHRKKLSEAGIEYFKHNEPLNTGKTFEEIYGVDRAFVLKNKLRNITLKQIEKYRQTDEYKRWLELKPEYDLYYIRVIEITNGNNLKQLENYSKRNAYYKYELDHIYPISLGFKNNIPAELIGDISNLRIIPRAENRGKSAKLIEHIIPEKIKNGKTYNKH